MHVRGMKGRMLRGCSAVALLTGALAGGLAAAPAQAGEVTASSWTCGGESGADVDGRYRILAWCRSSGGSSVSAVFYAHGEYLHVNDAFDNDRSSVANLHIGGSGTAQYTNGYHNLSYSEGKDADLQVCTSSSANAVCSPMIDGHT